MSRSFLSLSRHLLVAATILIVGLTAALLHVSRRSAAALQETLPSPNGFTELLAIEKAWATAPSSTDETNSSGPLPVQIQRGELERRLHAALQLPVLMPLDVARQAFQASPGVMSDAQRLFR